MSKKIRFRTNSRHISQLGRELVTDFVTALTELIKNAYDADADGVKIIFDNIKSDEGKIIIIDTGTGMTQNDVENKWMVIGTNNKVRDNYSKLGRKRVGKKGIGRFSVERLAENVNIYSFTEYEKPFKFSINWNKYEEININNLKQKINILKNMEDEESAKYIKNQIQYFLLSSKISEEDKKKLNKILEIQDNNYRIFYNKDILHTLEEKIIPILAKYENIEEKIDDIYNEIELLSKEEQNEKENMLLNYYKELKIDREVFTGTIIVLENLRDNWKEKHINRLQKDLRQLVAPDIIEHKPFKINLVAPEFKIEDTTMINDILDANFAHIKASIKENGKRMVIDYEDRNGEKKNIDKILPNAKLCGDAEVEIYYFIRDAKNLITNTMGFSEIRKLLDIYCGIKIYRDNFRVKPYGDIGNDWLLLDQNKVKDTHGYLVGNNQTIGTVKITDEKNGMLVDATNREGIIENEAYEDLKEFVQECINIISEVRYNRFMEEQEENERLLNTTKEEQEELNRETINIINESNKNIEDISNNKYNGKYNEQIENTKKSLEVAGKNIIKSQENTKKILDIYETKMSDTLAEANLYKNLASLGILSAEFGHETKDISSRTKSTLQLLNDQIDKLPLNEKAIKYIEILNRDLKRIMAYIDINNNFISNRKRNMGKDINVRKEIKEICELYKPLIEEYGIYIKLDCDDDITYDMYIMDLESIIINLFTNSFEQLKKVEKRIIRIRVEDNDNNITIRFSDTGEGIKNIKEEEIFLPFKTTKENGIGLGMCIVKSMIEKYKGTIEVAKPEKNKGAEFIIQLPKKED